VNDYLQIRTTSCLTFDSTGAIAEDVSHVVDTALRPLLNRATRTTVLADTIHSIHRWHSY
jgi:hypothetical protein